MVITKFNVFTTNFRICVNYALDKNKTVLAETKVKAGLMEASSLADQS